MSTAHYDVAIIGGGLFGCFTGFFLARMGKTVAIIERGYVGAQSSGANFGGLRLQGRSISQYPLSLLAQAHWENFDALIGEGCEYDRNGMVYFAYTETGRERLLAYASNSRACGLDIVIWQGAELRQNLPWLADSALIASYSPRCAVANPRLATPAVARAMLRHGGTLLENIELVRATWSDDLFRLECQDGREIHATKLLNAAGGWANAICTQFGEPVPLFSAGPPQFVTEPLPYHLKPSVYAIEGDLIIRQIPRGNYIFAGYPRTLANADGRHTFVPPHKTLNGMRAVASHIPALSNAEVIRVWSGVEGYLPDMLPVIGESQTTPGLFHAFGASGGGFQIAPAVGECLAQIICDQPPSVDLATYSISRFQTTVEKSEKIAREFDA
ncbi:NAD(P)/FAD-dependent oxidoreductase [Limoniibacter endophyticus]|uniref:Sarcosine oxidase subunit beta n=1 Tax=Limoniibacter endophyticus TaxID=1565040 RepID=A0A8J3DHN3_9HYPH|nr:FAD-binding oxidoreductase [Limoniibacter endophyticus]GHC72634.1 sarcosine oxidase subunit beta [Limoniibacter endophyticus]